MPKVTMPQLGESVAEGTIGRWLKQVGEHVDKYEPIVEVITDKVNAEVPSPFAGTLTQILVEEGATVPNNAEIAVIEGAGEAAATGDGAGVGPAAAAEETAPTAATPAPSGGELPTEVVAGAEAVADETPGTRPADPSRPLEERSIFGSGGHGPAGSDERASQPDAGVPTPATTAVAPSAGSSNGAQAATAAAAPSTYEGRMTPAVRRLAREHGVDLSLIAGTGHAGRVTREDVMAFVEAQRAGGTATASAAPAPAAPAPAAPAAGASATAPTAPLSGTFPSGGPLPAAPAPSGATAPVPAAATAQATAASAPTAAPAAQPQALAAPVAVPGQDELKPNTPMRKAIAAHMVRSKQTAPHAYTTVEVDMSAVVALRESVKGQYQAREGVSLSYVPFVTKAVVEALRRHPDLNAHWTDEGLLRKRDVNVGIAVAVDDGLVVPVIKNADQLSIHGLNRQVQDLAARARANRLRLEDIQGGTFTVNNTGWFGSVASQPIINVPEIAILSMEAIVKRPVVIESPAGDSIAIRPIMNVCVSFDHRGTDGAQIGRFVQDVRRWLESVDANTPVW